MIQNLFILFLLWLIFSLFGKIIGENILSAKKSEIETSYSIDLQKKMEFLPKKIESPKHKSISEQEFVINIIYLLTSLTN